MSINPVQKTHINSPLENAQNLSVRPLFLNHSQVPDTLITCSTSCIQWVHEIREKISGFFKKIANWISSFFGMRQTSNEPLILYPHQTTHRISHPNKIYAYNQLLQERPMSYHPITAQKFASPDVQSSEALPIFTTTKPLVTSVAGPFRYDCSTENTIHWTANFADSNLFGFCEGPLMAQDELQVLEHPGLAHIKHTLPKDLCKLGLHEVALFQNVPRLGSLDTTTPLANGQTLYGNYFARATTNEIHSLLTRFSTPTLSNIFAMTAPRIPFSWNGLPYQKKELSELFFTAYNAFRSIKSVNQGKKIVIHTGNWGAGAFGNDAKTAHLVQLAAAEMAGIDEIRMHPMTQPNSFVAAKQLIENLRAQFPQMTSGQFLDHLTSNATAYDLRYRQGNGT